MIQNIRLSELPPYGKLFVGLFTTLMLFVCLWAMAIFYVEKGLVTVDEYELSSGGYDTLPAEAADGNMALDIEGILADSASELAPDWDSNLLEEQVEYDSAELADSFEKYDAQAVPYDQALEIEEYPGPDDVDHIGHNLGLAHTHINGQTLLFFALGLVFIFTSVKPRVKKTVLLTFAVAVLVHAVGLTGEGFHWFFDDILAISGVAILVSIIYMALMIYVDLARGATAKANSEE
ncbi:MAG: hypothetical protein AB1483_01495 [Candidatus Zixiibacteriota bacterium]